jgi:hypothetical protein
MILTSYQRLLRYLAGEGGAILTDKAEHRRDIDILLEAVSGAITAYLHRRIESQTRTQYFDVGYAQKEFWIDTPLISSITSVKEDSTGRFDGDEATLDATDYHIGTESNSVILVSSRSWEAKRGLEITYVGGLAAHAVRSTFIVGSIGGWTVGQYCIGTTSTAVGIIRTVNVVPVSLVIEVLYGIFEVGEIITEHGLEDGSDAAGGTTTISSKSATALCEYSPFNSIVTACEVEMRYWLKHKFDFENDSTERDGFSIRRAANQMNSLQPETRLLLDPLRIPVL